MPAVNLLAGATAAGCRRSRYGDFVIVTLQSLAFAVPAQELLTAENWARSRSSLGSGLRDQTAFIGRFENLLARSGGGLATRGARSVLLRILQGMTANGVLVSEWSVPHNINESVEVQKKKPAALPAADPTELS